MAAPKNAAAKPAKDNPAEQVVIEAIEPIRHDGLDVSVGTAFAVLPDTAAVLLASGAARIPSDAPESAE